MKLEFTLLVVDDAPDSIEQAISTLREHLEEKGFTLQEQVQKDFSDQDLIKLARLRGQDYDLVVVDYNLGLEDMTGAEIARKLRTNLPFTDMVFYSSDSAANLLGELAKHEVPGVFTATRQELDEALKGLADTVIGKAVDLNHMRGIAMAEVAEMDVLMEETLARAFQTSNTLVDAAAERTTEKLRANLMRIKNFLDERLSEDGLPQVVTDGRLFPHTQKFWAIRRLAKSFQEECEDEWRTLATYQTEVIDNRNLLAHAKERKAADGSIELLSIKDGMPVAINESWMADFRRKLQKHRSALAAICGLIDRKLA